MRTIAALILVFSVSLGCATAKKAPPKDIPGGIDPAHGGTSSRKAGFGKAGEFMK